MAERILEDVAVNGGLLAEDDLTGYRTTHTDPVGGTYRASTSPRSIRRVEV